MAIDPAVGLHALSAPSWCGSSSGTHVAVVGLPSMVGSANGSVHLPTRASGGAPAAWTDAGATTPTAPNRPTSTAAPRRRVINRDFDARGCVSYRPVTSFVRVK